MSWGVFRPPWRPLPPVLGWIPTKEVTDRRAIITWAELEVPDEPRRAVVTWAELEVPNEPRRGVVTWAELEVPDEPRRGIVTWAEFEVPTAPARGIITWAELEVPNEPRRGIVTWAELEVPNEPRRGIVTWAEFEVPNEPRRGIVTWAEFEVPDAAVTDRRGIITWAEFEVPDFVTTDRRAIITWAEFEVPSLPIATGGGRNPRGVMRFLYLQVPEPPRTRPVAKLPNPAWVTWLVLSIPSQPAPSVGELKFSAPIAPRAGALSGMAVEAPSAPIPVVAVAVEVPKAPEAWLLLTFVEVPDADDGDLIAALLADGLL